MIPRSRNILLPLFVIATFGVALAIILAVGQLPREVERVETADEIRAWNGYYHACFNVRYREIDGDDGLADDWKKIEARYKVQYDAAAPAAKELDQLYLDVDALERREKTPVKLEVAHRAQGDVNERFFAKRTYEEIRANGNKAAPVAMARHADPILPDPKFTPGEVLPDATLKKVKEHGYSATTRDVDESKKKAVFARYGIPWERHSEFEVDHSIPASYGGASTLLNLWPQNYSGPWGARVKDRVETHVLAEIRAGRMDLKEAQTKIARDWISFYKEVFGPEPKAVRIEDSEQ